MINSLNLGIKDHDDIINYLSTKYNIDKEVVEKAVRTEFKFVKDTMEQGELEPVHLQSFGKFAIKPGRMKYLLDDGYEIKKKKV